MFLAMPATDEEDRKWSEADVPDQQRGHPKLVNSSAQSRDEDLQRRVWTVSEELTGVNFGV
jgi:hypothetical protein